MDEENKVDKLLDVDGLEEWMNQFVIDPLFDGNTDGIRMDLFETESSYIIEAIVPGFNKKDITINVAHGGIQILLNKTGVDINRFVKLPFSLCRQKISATIEHNIIEILIYKNKMQKKSNRNIRTIRIK